MTSNAKGLSMGILLALAAALGGLGCDDGEEKNKSCTTVGASDGCAEGQVCAEVTGGDPRCYAPLLLRGQVLDASDDSPIEGARVQAADENGAAVGTAAVSDADGRFELQVPAARDGDGKPASGEYSLRAQAAGYEPFPSAIRPALPIAASGASAPEGDGGWVLEGATTTILLLPLHDAGQGLGSIAGAVLGEQPAGVLVIAEGGPAPSPYGFSAADGSYVIYNVPAGEYTVRGYAAGVQLEPAGATLATGQALTGVDLAASTRPLSTVNGTVNIVETSGLTSVVLAVESTFLESAARGEVPPGLRAPPPGTPPNLNGNFSIEGVPDGRYVVLAAFENDGLARDPDLSIAGTQILHIELPPATGTVLDIPDNFKVNEALAVVSPGGPGAAIPDPVATATPDLVWGDDSGEDSYELYVYDAYGDLVWSKLDVARVTGSPNVTVAYAGPALEAGMVYQFRVRAIKDGGPIAQSEDLMGIFTYQPQGG
ncbi:MAG TPA: carboxypeptidase regulatory-like domain-containing protein [Myxococcota bacterium]|nr:carboxypeptidase regulatory-like domain-containing protein [Myxococcota bacterium]HRY92992.1 carboxypeptidase regulatory-like domain-containing protein [Myxococcota bacterium]HSA21316.1 carboxypeptidase regulatory-like domain-containing protein [Myxococcota bacterium]